MNLILKTNVLINGSRFLAGSVVEMAADEAANVVARGLADYQDAPQTGAAEDEASAKPTVKRRTMKKVME